MENVSILKINTTELPIITLPSSDPMLKSSQKRKHHCVRWLQTRVYRVHSHLSQALLNLLDLQPHVAFQVWIVHVRVSYSLSVPSFTIHMNMTSELTFGEDHHEFLSATFPYLHGNIDSIVG